MRQAGLGVELSDGSTIGGMLFADDLVGVSNNSEEELQRLINVAHAKRRLKANVSKSAVVVFAWELVQGSWNSKSSNGAWDKGVLQNGNRDNAGCFWLGQLLSMVVRCGKVRLRQQR